MFTITITIIIKLLSKIVQSNYNKKAINYKFAVVFAILKKQLSSISQPLNQMIKL